MSKWKVRDLTDEQRRVKRRAIIWFLVIVFSAFFVEVVFLFALNDDDLNGRHAFLLWGLAITWMAGLFTAFLISSVPDNRTDTE